MGESRGDRIMSGTVISLKLQKNKGEDFCEEERLILEAEKGICGDCHYGSKKGQVCILDEECRRWIEEENEEGLCLSRFQENILIGGAMPEKWHRGGLLRIGDVLLEITQKGKKCFQECSRVQEGRQCRLKKSCYFSAVQRGGTICRGNAVFYENRKR